MGALLGGLHARPLKIQIEFEERSLTGDSDKDSRGSSNNGDLPRPEVPQGATGQNPNSPETSETLASRGERLFSGVLWESFLTGDCERYE
jgi:hypothetical protein